MVWSFCLSCIHLQTHLSYALGYCPKNNINKYSTLHNCKFYQCFSSGEPKAVAERMRGIAHFYFRHADMMITRAHLVEKYVDYLDDPEAGDMDHLREVVEG